MKPKKGDSFLVWGVSLQHQTSLTAPAGGIYQSLTKNNWPEPVLSFPIGPETLSFLTRNTEAGRPNSKRNPATANGQIQEDTFSLQTSDAQRHWNKGRNQERICNHSRWPIPGSLFVTNPVMFLSCPETARQLVTPAGGSHCIPPHWETTEAQSGEISPIPSGNGMYKGTSGRSSSDTR